MKSANLQAYERFVEALERFAGPEEVGAMWTHDIEFHELPNLLVPNGRVRSRSEALAGLSKAPVVLSAQRYEVLKAVESGETLVLDLDWSGTLRVPLGQTPVGGVLRARFAAFVTFRDGLICEQTNFDCYQPF